MMHLQSLDVSRLLKGRTRTATFTEDMLDVSYDGNVSLLKSKCFSAYPTKTVHERKTGEFELCVHNNSFSYSTRSSH